MKFIQLRQFFFFLPVIIAFLLYFYPNNFELFPRVGWVDAGMYVGYSNNGDILINDYGFSGHNYQGTRLGYVVPAKFFSSLVNPIVGRYLFVLSLFLAALVSLFMLAKKVTKKVELQSLFMTMTVCSPLLLAGLSYGGADGPSAIYTILSGVFLYTTVYTYKYNFGWLILAGFFAALNFSTHVLALIPLTIIFISYLFFNKFTRKSLIVVFMAFFITLIGISIIGYLLGLEKNYLFYSLAWGAKSVRGKSPSFEYPFNEIILYYFVYLPPIILVLTSVKFLDFRKCSLKNYKEIIYGNMAFIAGILCFGPLLFIIAYDKILGGSIREHLSYYQLLYPCFIFSFLFIITNSKVILTKNSIILVNLLLLLLVIFSILNVSALISAIAVLGILLSIKVCALIFNRKTDVARKPLFGSVLLLVIPYFCFAYVKPVLPFYGQNGANTLDLYQSELHFISTIESLSPAYSRPYFIYDSNAHKNNLMIGQFYQIYFQGEKMIFNYFDSLTALYLWDRSILTNKPYSPDFENIVKGSDRSRQIVLLGSKKEEVEHMNKLITSILPTSKTIYHECYQNKSYPWCIEVVREFSSKD